jgi:hypothetical protein
MNEDALRQWASAERVAILAEEMVRNTLAASLRGEGPPPSPEMQRSAAVCREAADSLFREVRKMLPERGVSGS